MCACQQLREALLPIGRVDAPHPHPLVGPRAQEDGAAAGGGGGGGSGRGERSADQEGGEAEQAGDAR